MSTCELVRPTHLQRQAVIYIRQSSPHQVLTCRESQKLQYDLRQRAIDLGWRAQDVRIVDCDLGKSASTARGRRGFEQLVADVALGKIGIIIAYDATRLARNCSDWYPLLDTCGYRDCLIGDRDGVYDPASLNGRVLLGFKGQMSELELHMLRGRLNAGILNKAKRGELALCLPVGLQRDASGQVLKHPNQEVQERLNLVFATFLRCKSAARVVRALKEQDLNLPRRDPLGDVAWRAPSQAGVCSILKNPAYAGAFVYGRTRYARGRPGSARSAVPQEQWRVCIGGKYPPYISWQTYNKIQAMLRDNYAEYRRNQTRGAPRAGKALLHGLVFCGECGHKMRVQYKRGTRYVCNHLRQQFQQPLCQLLPADPIDLRVAELFMAAFSAVELNLHAQVMARVSQQRRQMRGASHQQLQRLRYQARLAERQFNLSDPDNRLVTAELEKRWEAALAALKQGEENMPRQEEETGAIALHPATRKALENVGRHLPELWPRLSPQRRKELLRCLIEKVVLLREQSDSVQIRVVWKGGEVTGALIPVPVKTVEKLSRCEQLKQEILKLSRQGIKDPEVAQRLTRAGFRSPSRNVVLPSTVREIRIRHGVLLHPGHPRPHAIAGCLTVSQLASKLGVHKHWIYDRIQHGVIQIARNNESKMYLIPNRQKTLEQFCKLVAGKLQIIRI